MPPFELPCWDAGGRADTAQRSAGPTPQSPPPCAHRLRGCLPSPVGRAWAWPWGEDTLLPMPAAPCQWTCQVWAAVCPIPPAPCAARARFCLEAVNGVLGQCGGSCRHWDGRLERRRRKASECTWSEADTQWQASAPGTARCLDPCLEPWGTAALPGCTVHPIPTPWHLAPQSWMGWGAFQGLLGHRGRTPWLGDVA